MEWAYRNQKRLERWTVMLGSTLILCDLLIASVPILARLEWVAVEVFTVAFGFYGVQAVLGLQLRIHGFTTLVRMGCEVGFVFFGSFSILALALGVIKYRRDFPLAISFLLFSSFALGALRTYARGKQREEGQGLAT